MKKGKIWSVVFLVIAFLTVWAVVSGSEKFSPMQLREMLRGASAGWMAAAAAGMLGFILFEGLAVLCILRAFGYRRSVGKGFLYSAADVYFSAITPSATGGQPASAFFMMRDGIPGAVVTITLVANLIMYTLALLTVGVAAILIRPNIFLHLSLLSKVFILIGYVVLCGMAAGFYMLIAWPGILEWIGLFFIGLGKRLHLVRHEEKRKKKLYHTMLEYRQCAGMMAGHRSMLAQAYLLNLLQRVSQISVTLFVYLAVGGRGASGLDIWFMQGFAAIGTYSVPIPGAMGVADYLIIDGLRMFLKEAEAVSLELISRGLSFYICMLVSAATVLAGLFFGAKRKKGN